MFELVFSTEFADWLEGLRDEQARTRILTRLNRVTAGNFGDAKAVGMGISELRLTYGPGYRVYYTMRGKMVVLLLCGGDKSTQDRDIQRAREIAADYEE